MDRLRLAQLYNGSTKERNNEIINKLDVSYSVSDEPLSMPLYHTFAGYNCLHIAVMKSDLSLTQQLLKLGADLLKQGTRDGKTPLIKAVTDKKYWENKSIWDVMGRLQKDPIIEILLSTQVESNVKINPKCKDGISHLHIACMFNHVGAVELFAKAAESLDQAINKENYKLPGYTALHLAVRYSSVEAVEILLRHGADIHIENAGGLSPLQLMIARLLDYSEFLTKGLRAVSLPYEQEVDRMNSIINSVLECRKANDIFSNNVGLSALHLACMLKDNSKAKYYLESNIDINLPVKHYRPGWTPLHFAACLNIETLKLLLQRGAKVDSKDKKGYRVLNLCLKNHSSEAVSAILSSRDVFANIMLSDASTKLSEALFAMNDCDRFENFLNNLTDANIFVPFDSPIWPGYSILHLAVSMNRRSKPWSDFANRTDQEKREEHQEKQYNCTEEEQLVYWKRIEMCLAKHCNVSAKNADGLSPVHLAFKWHLTDLVKLLLSHSKENVADSNNLSLLHIACAVGKRDAVKNFLQQGADVNDRVASSFEWHEMTFNPMNELKPKKMKIFAKSTPLHVAAMFGHKKIARVLIDGGADVYAKDRFGLTPIHLTMGLEPGMNQVADMLFDTPNLRDSVSDAGLSHLHTAVYHEDAQAAERLLQAGANVNQVVEKKAPGMQSRFAGETPLHVAGYDENLSGLLVRYGADVTVENPFDNYDTPLITKLFELEFHQSFVEGLKNSMETGPFDSNGMTRLHVACATFQLDWAEQLLEAGADPNAQVSCSRDVGWNLTPLHFLLNYVDYADDGMPRRTVVDLVKLMLRYGADVLRSDGSRTPLHVVYSAISSRESDGNRDTRETKSIELIADLMLRKLEDYNENPQDANGFSLFHFACVRDKAKIVRKFLDNGVDVNYSTYPFANVNTAGYTPLHFAFHYGNAKVARLLIERGADVKAEDRYGNTPLHSLVNGGYHSRELIDISLNKGADINAKNLQNETPLELLVHYYLYQNEFLQLLFDRRATIDIEKHSIAGEGMIGSMINNAVPEDKEVVLKSLIEYCDVKEAIRNGFHAIHSVVSVNKNEIKHEIYLKIIQQFIEMGAELDETNLKGDTPLYTALSFHNFEAVKALLFLGADLNLVEKENEPSLIMRVVNSYNRDRKTLLLNHLWKMNVIGLDVASSIRPEVKDIEWIPGLDLVERSQRELNKAKITIISQSLTLDMFLSEWRSVMRYPMMSIVQRQDVDVFFKQDSMIFQEFPELAGLLMMHYRKALARMKLMQPAKEILVSSNINLPDLCLEEILKYFKNVDLEFLIEESDEDFRPRKRQKVE